MNRLFDNQREVSLASAQRFIAATLTDLGHDPASCVLPPAAALHRWSFRTGSAVTAIEIYDASPLPHVRVRASVLRMTPTTDRAGLFPHLLAQNNHLCGIAFAISGDQVNLVSERSILDLDHSEIRDLIRRLAEQADDYDDRLVASYGGELASA